MKKSILAASILVVTLPLMASAQVSPELSAANRVVTKTDTLKPEAPVDASKATRARVLNPVSKNSSATTESGNNQTFQAHASGNFKNRARLESLKPDPPADATQAPTQINTAKVMTGNISGPAPSTSVAPPFIIAATASEVYRVGIGDVLDIQFKENPTDASTLFTVLGAGQVDYPLAGEPLKVVGMTTEEIASALKTRIRLFDNPSVVVNVRDYASHTVSISGFVGAPGTKMLRREAVPLYAILAESQMLSEATRVTITRGGNTTSISLKDIEQSATLVVPGDQLKVWP